jgi:hypothetical protein
MLVYNIVLTLSYCYHLNKIINIKINTRIMVYYGMIDWALANGIMATKWLIEENLK